MDRTVSASAVAPESTSLRAAESDSTGFATGRVKFRIPANASESYQVTA
jgi:hypothetical protein